ncbi:MAG: RNA 3'-phosphate cyclase [Chloroflexi bacterium]|nr:RNA 3'-phosphate cyclase [Chloroflexota bacterium]
MIHVDGGQKSGSGTIVRYAVSLAALLGQELELTNIRARRDKPGLRPQHLAAVRAVADVCGGELEGAKVDASRIVFRPGSRISGGHFQWDIGTSGSTTMLAYSLLPIACFAESPLTCRISGGLFQDFAPSAFHMQHVLLPALRGMGGQAELEMVRPGYLPRGGGIIELRVKPVGGGLKPLQLTEQGNITSIDGMSLSSHLQERKVSDRMAAECQRALAAAGHSASIKPVYDSAAVQAGAALAVFARTDTGCIIGADGAGALRRTSENIGRSVAGRLIEDLATGATVDRFLADQLIIFAALARGVSRYRIPRLTEHVETNLWLVQKVLGVRTRVGPDMVVEVEGMGYETERGNDE